MRRTIKTLLMLAIGLLTSTSSMADDGNVNEQSNQQTQKSAQVHVTVRSTKPRPRSLTPEFNAWLVNDTVNTSIKYYSGNVVVYVSDQSGTDYISDTHCIYDESTFSVDVATLLPGEYTIYYVMEDGTVYGGDFSIIQ